MCVGNSVQGLRICKGDEQRWMQYIRMYIDCSHSVYVQM